MRLKRLANAIKQSFVYASDYGLILAAAYIIAGFERAAGTRYACLYVDPMPNPEMDMAPELPHDEPEYSAPQLRRIKQRTFLQLKRQFGPIKARWRSVLDAQRSEEHAVYNTVLNRMADAAL